MFPANLRRYSFLVSLISCPLIVTWIIIFFSRLLVIVIVYGGLGLCRGRVYPTWGRLFLIEVLEEWCIIRLSIFNKVFKGLVLL